MVCRTPWFPRSQARRHRLVWFAIRTCQTTMLSAPVDKLLLEHFVSFDLCSRSRIGRIDRPALAARLFLLISCNHRSPRVYCAVSAGNQ